MRRVGVGRPAPAPSMIMSTTNSIKNFTGTTTGSTFINPFSGLPLQPGQTIPLPTSLPPFAFQQFMNTATGRTKEYESQMTTRVAVPIQSARWGAGRLEMTIGQKPGTTYNGLPFPIEISIVLPGREVIDFNLQPADLDNLVSQRTMDKLSK